MIRRMVADLNLPVELRALPTVREADGLAMSSRNNYLGPEDRAAATVLNRALQAGASAFERQPAGGVADVIAAMAQVVAAEPAPNSTMPTSATLTASRRCRRCARPRYSPSRRGSAPPG